MSIVADIEDDDHTVELWKGDKEYIYVEDLVKRAGVVRLIMGTDGSLIARELPACFGGDDEDTSTYPEIYF